jgi:starch synthase
LKIVVVSPEAIPFVKTGGLADVAGALTDEYIRLGAEATLILPYYRSIKKLSKQLKIKPLNVTLKIPIGDSTVKGTLLKGKSRRGADVYFIKCDKYFDRDELYSDAKGDYPDNASRFIFFCRGVLEALNILKIKADIIHCNDWQTALIPIYMKTLYSDRFQKTVSVMTIHNLGYQGVFWHLDMPLTGLGWEMFNMESIEFHGMINFLKAGIIYSDIVTTVSRTYADEILTEEYGAGLDGVLRKRVRDLHGIINGIDLSEWGPWGDKFISKRYSKKNLAGKYICKKELMSICGLRKSSSLLIGMVSRIASQKGIDIILESLDEIMKAGHSMVILGRGDEELYRSLLERSRIYPGQLSVNAGFDDALAHRIYAGSDLFLMPSLYEPCGLGQLIALRYGTIPVARMTGGLADTIIDHSISSRKGTGFLFKKYSGKELLKAIGRAYSQYKDNKAWGSLVFNAMAQDFSWRQSARQYISLYKSGIQQKKKSTKK